VRTSKNALKVSGVFDISNENFVFKELLPMNHLWNEYIKSLLGE